MINMSNFWTRILGFKPEAEFEVPSVEDKCYKCGSERVYRCGSSSWTGKKYCDNCGYYTFIVYSDRMGGGLTDDVAIDKQNFNL